MKTTHTALKWRSLYQLPIIRTIGKCTYKKSEEDIPMPFRCYSSLR